MKQQEVLLIKIFRFYKSQTTLLQLRITNIKEETYNCKSFFVIPVNDTIQLTYKAGQFLTLIIPHAQREIRRSYSIGSTPGVDDKIFFTVKRKINGEISRRLSDHYKVGDIITSLEPSGRFIIEEPFVQTHFFIAAGSGITPVFSLIKKLLHFHANTNIILINQSLNEDAAIYNKQLHTLHKLLRSRFTLIQLFSQPKHYHFSKRLNNIMLENIVNQYVNNFTDVRFYLCGPVAYMRMAQFTLKLMGFTDEQIRKEQFVIDAPPTPPLITDSSAKQVTVFYKNFTYKFTMAYPKNILDAALQKGIQLPYSCKAGRCSTCMAKCKNGQVIMSTNEVLTEKDIAQGYVLTCVGFAKTDVTLSFDEGVY